MDTHTYMTLRTFLESRRNEATNLASFNQFEGFVQGVHDHESKQHWYETHAAVIQNLLDGLNLEYMLSGGSTKFVEADSYLDLDPTATSGACTRWQLCAADGRDADTEIDETPYWRFV